MSWEEEWTLRSGENLLCSPDAFIAEAKRKFRRPMTWPSQEKPRPPIVHKVGGVTFFDRLYALCSAGKSDAALDLLLDEIDPLIDAGQLARCGELLETVDLQRVTVPVALGFLSATALVRHRLPVRPRFVDAVLARIGRERVDAERLVAPFR